MNTAIPHRFDISVGGAKAGVYSTAEGHGVVIPHQTHSCNVAVIGREGTIPSLEETDAIVSLAPGLAVGVRTADCVPVLLYAPDIRAVAAIHAGWKGSLGGIVDRTVQVLVRLGARPASLYAAFGPSVCPACYEVSPEMIEMFRSARFGSCITAPRHIDLEAVNKQRLTALGVSPTNIRPKDYCTRETTWLPSWRRQPGITARLLSWIML